MKKFNNEYLFTTILLTVISIFTTIDVIADYQEGTPTFHLIIELVVIFLSLIAITLFLRKVLYSKSELTMTLNQTRDDLVYWKEKLQR